MSLSIESIEIVAQTIIKNHDPAKPFLPVPIPNTAFMVGPENGMPKEHKVRQRVTVDNTTYAVWHVPRLM